MKLNLTGFCLNSFQSYPTKLFSNLLLNKKKKLKFAVCSAEPITHVEYS